MFKKFDYDKFVSRNYLYISPELQNKIKNTTLAFFGTGLSSSIVVACVRLGFTKFIFVDGDKVELHNLNRQDFIYKSVGRSKVKALKIRALKINPDLKIVTKMAYIKDVKEVKAYIDQSDIVINTIDFCKANFDIIDYVRKANKLIICPFNPGFGGITLNFTANSPSPYEIFSLENGFHDIAIIKQLFERYPEINTLNDTGLSLDDFLNNSQEKYFPQMVISASITTGMVLNVIKRYLNGEAITIMPEIYYKKI